MKLRVQDVSFSYPNRLVLDRVAFDVAAERLVGVIGPNGAGKSTLLQCMHTALAPSSGNVLVDEVDLSSLSRRDVALRVAVVPQACNPGFRVSVEDFVGMGRFAHEPFLAGPTAEDAASTRRALADVDMEEYADRSVLELSGGEFRRVLIAQALAQSAPVLLLDEPVQQLDLRHQIEVMELVRVVSRRPQSAAVVVLHDLNLAARYCHSLVLLSRGRVVAAGHPDTVITAGNLRDVYGVEAVVDRCPATGSIRATPLGAAVPSNVPAASNRRDTQ